ncbi:MULTISPECIES: DUF488 domain-containing protein [Streptomyces]|uniref:DUF488 family protein n=1 Tax=Streptomyces lycii TaxID=2654337 RepID=A0ABQ7FRV8_9ACTN|nr:MULTISPECIES: DUF488 family protein [Streptomyces]KAF4410614.1 DUF488 family protein [Streptomyces lycii]PGH51305.1 hypothetical protein CRI70_07445 [Streptomyces sp. Ru87]
MHPDIRTRRVYDPPEPSDGTRVLADRVWPRGLTKEAAALDVWCKEAAPSTELRRWYGHAPERRAEFARRYEAELAEPERRQALDRLRELAREGRLTLLTATKDLDLSHVGVLAEALRDGGTGGKPRSRR